MRTFAVTAAAFALAGLTACTAASDPEADPTPSPTVSATTASEEPTPSADASESTDVDPRLAILVGTWEGELEEVGWHGSTMEIREDATAAFASSVNLHGAYEGAITLGDAEAHRFEGTEPVTGEDLVLEVSYDAEADTLTVVYSDGLSHEHFRA